MPKIKLSVKDAVCCRHTSRLNIILAKNFKIGFRALEILRNMEKPTSFKSAKAQIRYAMRKKKGVRLLWKAFVLIALFKIAEEGRR